mmetsp:Transcript_20362/g.45427  ORF Transcript_20362/g.45427 Transcript_20362/m.45427 type:complete len:127 (+) Transcript_20362:190-570(+)
MRLLSGFLSREENASQAAVGRVTLVQLIPRDGTIVICIKRFEYAVDDFGGVPFLPEIRSEFCFGNLAVTVGVNCVEHGVGLRLAKAECLKERCIFKFRKALTQLCLAYFPVSVDIQHVEYMLDPSL